MKCHPAPATVRAVLAFALAWASAAASAQVLEVLESRGFAETRIPAVGWRQAVVGRQLPEGSTATTWLAARAVLAFPGVRLELGELTHLRVLALESGAVRLSLTAGSLVLESEGTRLEVEFGGAVLRLENGTAEISGDVLKLISGTAVLSGAGPSPRILEAGTVLRLSERRIGSVFPRPGP